MKRVIGGKLYSTDGAKKLGFWSNGLGYGDFSHCEETLYRTKSGAYFIHGVGGPMSRYARSVGQNQWGDGEHIEPVDFDTAKRWAEEKLGVDEYVSIFGKPEEA